MCNTASGASEPMCTTPHNVASWTWSDGGTFPWSGDQVQGATTYDQTIFPFLWERKVLQELVVKFPVLLAAGMEYRDTKESALFCLLGGGMRTCTNERGKVESTLEKQVWRSGRLWAMRC